MLPLPSRTHPQKQNLVVYTEKLTHLSGTLDDSQLRVLFAQSSFEGPGLQSSGK